MLFIFLSLSSYNISELFTGNYPYIKRLNNGNYISISSTKILFLDGNLDGEIYSYNFENCIYQKDSSLNEDMSTSTIVEQFSSKDKGLIVAIIENKIYIFYNDGRLISSQATDFIKENHFHSIIPINHIENDYYFWIIYPCEDGGNDIFTCGNFYYRKIKFNSNDKSIEIGDEQNYEISSTYITTIKCIIMRYNEENVISCYYGKLGEAHLTLYNLENFNLIRDSIKNNDDGGNSGGNYYYLEIMDAKKRMLYVV